MRRSSESKMSRPESIGEQVMNDTTVQINKMALVFHDAGVERPIQRGDRHFLEVN